MKTSYQQSSRKQRADSLQFLRFLAFFLIFLWHADVWVPKCFPRGYGAAEAVSFFFILSGLVIGYTTYDTEEKFTVKSMLLYLWNKVRKVYPLYFFTTIFTVVYTQIPKSLANYDFFNIKDSVIQLFKNLFLVQSWFKRGYFSFNGVGWFLSTIMFLYFLKVPLVALLCKIRKNKNKYAILTISSVAIIAFIVLYCYLFRDDNMEFYTYVFPPSRLGEYMLGMIVGVSVRSIMEDIPDFGWNKTVFTCLEIVSLIIWICALYYPVIAWHVRIVHWLFPNLVLLCIFTIGKGMLSDLFRTRFLKLLGDISFEGFLLHQVIISVYISLSGVGETSKLGNVFSILFCLGLTIVLSYLLSKKCYVSRR